MEEDVGSTYYGFPNLPGQGVKTALHHSGETCAPETIDRTVHPSDVEHMRAALARRVPSLAESRLIKSAACMYTNTPDKHFVVGRHPAHSRVTLGVGYSRHGFKFSSAMGELLVGMALGESTLQVPGIFAPERFIAQ